MPVTKAPAATPHDALGPLPHWDLTHLYEAPDAKALKADMAWAEEEAKAFEAGHKDKLVALLAGRDGGTRLAAAIARLEKLDDMLGRIGSYAGLLYASDTMNHDYAKFYGDMQQTVTDIAARLLFFTLELNHLDDAALEAAMAAAPALARYRPWIEDVRKEKPHQLDGRLEQLFLEKNVTGASAWNRLFDETIAALKFRVDGEELGLEQTLNLLQDRDEARRRAASEALATTLKANLRIFTLITNTLAKDKDIADRWRGFTDVAASRHLANRVEPAVVDALVKSVQDAYPVLSHRYYRLKARWFGRTELNHWDRNAPLPAVEQPLIPWQEAKRIVLDAYAGFSPQLSAIAARFFDENWIDAPCRTGKAPGAFAHPTVPSSHPYVLLNYQGRPRDVMTLAHELGHGVHQVLAGHNGALMAPTPLTLAETASVFGEMLTFKALLAKATTQAERKAMLAQKVEDMINTVVRQIAFYAFERKVHERRKTGELTTEALAEAWMSVQADSLGPAIRLHEGYETFWAYIPHFIHSPFYVYAYAFGDCLVNSLYALYEQAPQGFAEKYTAMLAAGGTKHHGELLKPFGLDAADPAFWQGGISVISGLIDELEAMEA